MTPPPQASSFRCAMQFVAIRPIILCEKRFSDDCQMHAWKGAQRFEGDMLTFPPGQAPKNSDHPAGRQIKSLSQRRLGEIGRTRKLGWFEAVVYDLDY